MPRKRRVPPTTPKKLCPECVAGKADRPREVRRGDTLCVSHATHRDVSQAKARATHEQRTGG